VFSHCLPSCSHHHPLPLTSVCGYALCLWLTSPDGNHTLSGHLDGSIYRFSFDANGRGPVNLKIATHSVSGFPSCRGLRVLHAMPAVLLVFALRLRCPQLLRGLCVCVTRLQCVPYALGWGKGIVAAGNDKKGACVHHVPFF
jgi:hypothetical protein